MKKIQKIILALIALNILLISLACSLSLGWLTSGLLMVSTLIGILGCWLAKSGTPERGQIDSVPTQMLPATQELFSSLESEICGQCRDASNENRQVQDILADAIGKLITSFTELEQKTSEQKELALTLTNGHDNRGSTSFRALFEQIEMVMQRLLDATIDNKSQTSQLVASMDRTQEQFQKVLGMLGEVRKIADQTNLLAINAAVEAARAGNAGKGFAVVAEEVRNLSIRSNRFSEQIDTSVQAISTALGHVGSSIRDLSEQSSQLVEEEQGHIKTTMEQAQRFNLTVEQSAAQISQVAETVSQQVRQAVTSLQFQDMSTQVIDTVTRRLESIEQLIHGLTQQTQQILRSTESNLVEQTQVIEAVFRQGAAMVRESHHNPVSQKSMDEGDIELF
nr:methyl-accepting chemotaxis protein [uncultured Desulfuromonas sp.]